jgi:RsiW-degrading membrane proteinase PrsW (M82 family)
LLLAILPTVVILVFILSHDRYNKEPLGLLIKLFIVGMLTVIPAILLERLFPQMLYPSWTDLLLSAFIGVALVEEGVKYLGARLFSYRNRAYDEIYDGVIYCVCVSLGFATVENILYVMQTGVSTAIIRAVTAVPAHTIFAVVMGYYMSMGRFYTRGKFFHQLMSLVAPITLHGIYDFILMTGYEYALLIFVPFVIFMYFRGIRIVKKTSVIPPIDHDGRDGGR